MDGVITTTRGGDPAVVTVEFVAGVPAPGDWLATPLLRYRIQEVTVLRSGRVKLRCERMGRVIVAPTETVWEVRHKPRSR